MADGGFAGRDRFVISPARPSTAERAYLRLGLDQPGRKLPLFDRAGKPVAPRVIQACLARGWAEQWFANPLAPGWLVCRLTQKGAEALGDVSAARRVV